MTNEKTTATTSANADPCGMTNKNNSKGKDKCGDPSLRSG
jgi:hypothetical protein